MSSLGRVLLAICAAVLLVVFGSPVYNMVVRGYRWRDRDAPPGGGPLSFKHWKAEVQKQRPSWVEAKLENDPSQSFAFFFDPKANQLVLCWYGEYAMRGDGSFGVHVNADFWSAAESAPIPAIRFSVRYSESFGNYGEYVYYTGDFIQIRDAEVKEIGFEFESNFEEKNSITDFKAERRAPNEWVVTKE